MTFTFDEAGVFPYFCVVHPTMQGVVVVEDEATAEQTAPTAIESTRASAPAVSRAGGATLEAPATTADAGNAGAPTAIAAGVGGTVLGVLGAGWGPSLMRRR